MSNKSHVGMESKLCPVCRQTHVVGVLLDKRLRNVLERDTVTGMQLCPSHQQQADDGNVWIIEIDPDQSTMQKNADGADIIADHGEIYFGSGRMRLTDTMFARLFDIAIPNRRVVFINEEALTMMINMLDAINDKRTISQDVPDDIFDPKPQYDA